MSRYDPWGPISSTLYLINDADLVENIIGLTGVNVEYPSMVDGAAHKTRIRAYKPAIQAVYDALGDDEKGKFAGTVAKGLLTGPVSSGTRQDLIDRLSDIGWTITDEGELTTQDALLSEQFFPAGTQHDAYVAIREVLAKASSDIMIVDAYMGSTIFPTLSAANPSGLRVRVLTTAKNLKADFHVEASKFRQQFTGVQLEVRTTTDFHDRFIAVDNSGIYHLGASVKDAGKRAFLVSHLQDQPIIQALKQYLDEAWDKAKLVDL